jgi:hypothetical protein
MTALLRNAAKILEYLLSRGCPWDADDACAQFTAPNGPDSSARWQDWHDTFEVVVDHTPYSSTFKTLLNKKALAAEDIAFAAKVAHSGRGKAPQ